MQLAQDVVIQTNKKCVILNIHTYIIESPTNATATTPDVTGGGGKLAAETEDVCTYGRDGNNACTTQVGFRML